jgi:flagellar L-ring protein FlgH
MRHAGVRFAGLYFVNLRHSGLRFAALCLVIATWASLQAGCADFWMRPQVAVLDPAKVKPKEPTASPAAPATGNIYLAGAHRGLFEDRRARLPGDIVTIQVQEKTSARQRSNTSLGRDGKVSGSVTAIPLLPLSILKRANAGGSSNNALDAKGETGSDNDFTGVITVTVLEVRANGNLVVSGEKQIGVNQNVDILRFSGVINPATIQPGNFVSSTQVADARLEYRGRGDIDRAQTTGWLSRFFLSWLPI